MRTYSLRSPSGFLQRKWAGECVVFSLEARETHLLTAPCAHVLHVLEQGSASSDCLSRELQLILADAQEQDVVRLLGEVVTTLEKIGLIDAQEGES